jgi:hypothetical protein
VEVVDGKVATMANGDVENSSTVHRGLARCAVTWSSSKKKKKKGVSGSLEMTNRRKWHRWRCSLGVTGDGPMEEKEDAGAHPF